jgi:adenylate cyclase class 2
VKLLNFEFKARIEDLRRARTTLKKLKARFVGTDHQVDTYFHVPQGRLKIREGHIENALIHYQRTNSARERRSDVELMLLPRRNSVRAILARALSVMTVVDKRREIYFAGNVKIHLDRVRGLGTFLEVEAMTRTGDVKKVRAQALKFRKLFEITVSDIVPQSYSDLLMAKRSRSARSR